MTLPLFTPMKPGAVAERMMARAAESMAKERAGMTAEQLMQLEKQIKAARARGDAEQLRSLQRTHYRETGAGG